MMSNQLLIIVVVVIGVVAGYLFFMNGEQETNPFQFGGGTIISYACTHLPNLIVEIQNDNPVILNETNANECTFTRAELPNPILNIHEVTAGAAYRAIQIQDGCLSASEKAMTVIVNNSGQVYTCYPQEGS